jgi:hypothetical protein
MIELIVNKGLEALGRYYSSYRGIVIDNVDPKNRGRLVLTIPSISGSAIWAEPKGLDGALQTGFKWLTPKKGQIVWVEFQNGDFRYPLWSYHGWALNEMPDELKDPDSLGFVTRKGHKFIIDDLEGTLNLTITDPDNEEKPVTTLMINKNIISLVTSDGDKDITTISLSEGKVDLETTDEISIKGKAINLMGAKEGLPLVSELVKKLNALEKELNTLKEATKLAAPGVVALVPTYAPVQTWSLTKTLGLTVKNDIENKEIKQ